ncbi:ATP-binding protein [Planobispora takensis]|uniref:Signal transduction histidine-protein kinase/phosphatase MprB n=1 Tax=Planobispora takensis TaxID=1367882 RepID=A0A8J3WVY9_9ACTN|nr:ATP-binding protein [Planobispora takensis]GII03565.1 two-component sensor histidine kinase [Planobispora takensis]
MRRRLLSSTLLVAAIAVLLLGIPLGVLVNRLIQEEAIQGLSGEAKSLLNEVDYARTQDQPIDPEQLKRKYPDRHILIYAKGTPPQVTQVGTEPAQERRLNATAESESGIYVSVSRDKTQIEQQIHAWLLLIVVLAAVALAVAVGLAVVQSRRLTLPLRDLAMIAERLGSGEARPSRHRYGIQELDRVAEVLDRSATRIADLLAREREFATDASHQLRTPLTGLTMRLEEIVAAADDPVVVKEEGEAAIVQAERLTAVIDELLAAARRQRHAQTSVVELDALLDQQFIEWGPAFSRVGRRLVLSGTRELKALGTSGGISQVVSTLLENSLKHGGGPVTVTTSNTDKSIVIEIADQGDGISEEIAPRVFERNMSGAGGTGLGLTLARALAAADGGRLELVRPRPAAFAIFLRPVGDSGRNRVVSGPA